jgi:hypothetical protein
MQQSQQAKTKSKDEAKGKTTIVSLFIIVLLKKILQQTKKVTQR